MTAAQDPAADIEALDRSPASEAIAALSPLFEGAPQFLAHVAAARPFGGWDELFERARAIAHGLPEAAKIELLDAHPRLGAPKAAVSASSSREQGYDQSPLIEPELASRLVTLNDAYEARFGFRYCVFVAGRPLASLVPGLEAALTSDRGAEIERGLDAVVDIARARHALARSAAGKPA